jgi:hypothetical protein
MNYEHAYTGRSRKYTVASSQVVSSSFISQAPLVVQLPVRLEWQKAVHRGIGHLLLSQAWRAPITGLHITNKAT